MTGVRKRLALLLCLAAAPASASVGRCDLALSLAMDVSSSLSPDDHKLIREGTAAALLNDEVLFSFTHGAVWLQLFEWADHQQVIVDWMQITGREDMLRVAALLVDAPMPQVGAMTDMGGALKFALEQFGRVNCDRDVVDLMTDGMPNEGTPPEKVLEDFDVGQHQVNVLFLGDQNGTAVARMQQVKFGFGSFLMPVPDARSFEQGMLRKLLAEVSMNLPAGRNG